MRWQLGWSMREVDPWVELGPELMVAWDRDVVGPHGQLMESLSGLTIYKTTSRSGTGRVEVVMHGVSDSASYWHVAAWDPDQDRWCTTLDGRTTYQDLGRIWRDPRSA